LLPWGRAGRLGRRLGSCMMVDWQDGRAHEGRECRWVCGHFSLMIGAVSDGYQGRPERAGGGSALSSL
jgi:hypothetical protein